MGVRRRVAALLAVSVAAGPVACSRGDGPQKALAAFLTAWHDGALSGQRLLDASGAPLAGDAAQAQLGALEGDLAARRPNLRVSGKPNVKKDDATAVVAVDWPVADNVTWAYPTTVRLQRKDDAWVPVFTPQTVHPELPAGAKLTLRRTAAERGPILDGAGQPVASNRQVVVVGVEPRRVTDQDALLGTLRSIFAELGVEIDLTTLPGRLKAAKPDAFVELATLRREDYDRVRLSLRGLNGTVFREGVLPLGPTRVFARALLGGVGEVTREILDKNPGKYQVGDLVGLSGLQQRYDDRLRGRPGVAVVIPGTPERELFKAEPQAGAAVRTTLDQNVQNAADKALSGEPRRTSLVALRVSDGAVLAVANGPTGGQLNLAFTARVPPGSTFKVVTALGLLDAGAVGLDTPVSCPATLTVDGRTFKNAHNLALGEVPFRTDFARSCNTAFASLAPRLGPDGLARAGTALGIGTSWDLGVDSFSGKVSSGGSAAERAAAAFGQGTTQVSPVALAAAAAAVSRGQWKQPTLITDPAPANRAPDGPALNPQSLAALRTMMREVVTAGTADVLRGLPGEPLHGKTGTAEFDNNPANTHSWFIGWRGDLAFAVFVENGGASTDTALPIAGKFLLDLGF